jgi:hypothetical protein
VNAKDFILSSPTRFTLNDGRETYPVTFEGLIGREGYTEAQMSGQWRILGMSFHHWANRYEPWESIRAKVAPGKSLMGYVWDFDHGSTRKWGRKARLESTAYWTNEAQEGLPNIRDFILRTGGSPEDPVTLATFKRQAVGYIKWAHAGDVDQGIPTGWNPEDLRAIRRAKTLDDAIAAFAPWDSEPSFMYMVMQGYF